MLNCESNVARPMISKIVDMVQWTFEYIPGNSSPSVSLLEVLPKDKKAKEEKTSVLGQTVVDLLPLLLGESPLQLTRRLHHPSGQEGPPGAGGEGGLGEGKVRTVAIITIFFHAQHHAIKY